MADEQDPFAHLSSAPISPSAEVIEFVAWIDRLLDDEDCQYASDTLTGMRASAKGYDRVTDAMRQAVQNIEDGAERGRQAKRGQGGFRRRYEGYGDGSRRRW